MCFDSPFLSAPPPPHQLIAGTATGQFQSCFLHHTITQSCVCKLILATFVLLSGTPVNLLGRKGCMPSHPIPFLLCMMFVLAGRLEKCRKGREPFQAMGKQGDAAHRETSAQALGPLTNDHAPFPPHSLGFFCMYLQYLGSPIPNCLCFFLGSYSSWPYNACL